jgi:hypothetical protein
MSRPLSSQSLDNSGAARSLYGSRGAGVISLASSKIPTIRTISQTSITSTAGAPVVGQDVHYNTVSASSWIDSTELWFESRLAFGSPGSESDFQISKLLNSSVNSEIQMKTAGNCELHILTTNGHRIELESNDVIAGTGSSLILEPTLTTLNTPRFMTSAQLLTLNIAAHTGDVGLVLERNGNEQGFMGWSQSKQMFMVRDVVNVAESTQTVGSFGTGAMEIPSLHTSFLYGMDGGTVTVPATTYFTNDVYLNTRNSDTLHVDWFHDTLTCTIPSTYSMLTVTDLVATDITATTITATTLNVSTGVIGTLNATTQNVSVQQITMDVGEVTTLNAVTANITTLNGITATVTHGTVTNLASTAAVIDTLTAIHGTITNLTSTTAAIGTLTATNETVTNGTVNKNT